jgi:hypothetical protein
VEAACLGLEEAVCELGVLLEERRHTLGRKHDVSDGTEGDDIADDRLIEDRCDLAERLAGAEPRPLRSVDLNDGVPLEDQAEALGLRALTQEHFAIVGSVFHERVSHRDELIGGQALEEGERGEVGHRHRVGTSTLTAGMV